MHAAGTNGIRFNLLHKFYYISGFIKINLDFYAKLLLSICLFFNPSVLHFLYIFGNNTIRGRVLLKALNVFIMEFIAWKLFGVYCLIQKTQDVSHQIETKKIKMNTQLLYHNTNIDRQIDLGISFNNRSCINRRGIQYNNQVYFNNVSEMNIITIKLILDMNIIKNYFRG